MRVENSGVILSVVLRAANQKISMIAGGNHTLINSKGVEALPPSVREVAERTRGQRECRSCDRTLPQSACSAASPLIEGAEITHYR